MTLLDCFGLYLGWDRSGAMLALRTYKGSVQLQLGHLLLGCDWFFNPSNARIKLTDSARDDGYSDVETLPHSRVIS